MVKASKVRYRQWALDFDVNFSSKSLTRWASLGPKWGPKPIFLTVIIFGLHDQPIVKL